MNDSEYREWAKSLTTLSPTQMSDLSSRMKLLGPVSAGDNSFGRRVSDIVCTVLRKHGGESVSPVTLAKYAGNPKLKDKLDALAAFMDSVSRKRLVQEQILKIGIELLWADLCQWQVAIGSHTLINHIHRIPATLNRHFPGYASSGLLERIVLGHNAETIERGESGSPS